MAGRDAFREAHRAATRNTLNALLLKAIRTVAVEKLVVLFVDKLEAQNKGHEASVKREPPRTTRHVTHAQRVSGDRLSSC